MPNTHEWSEFFRRLNHRLTYRGHFTWGPMNLLVLLIGSGATGALLGGRGQLTPDLAVGGALAVVFMIALLSLGRRWEHALGGTLLAGIALVVRFPEQQSLALVLGLGLSAIAACAVQVIDQWDKAILLRLGRFQGQRGPGFFMMLPFLERIEATVDQRVRATDFRAERILTLDTVPVYVDAICFWLVWDAGKAVLEVENYSDAVIHSAQTALKDAVGRHELAELLSNRQKLGEQIQSALEEKLNPWGITIQSIELTDVVIPEGLEEAMSKRAQADRERQARVILAAAESDIAASFVEAAATYRDDPTALHLRAMNMVYEGIRQQGSMILVPSSAIDSMGLGAVPGLAALARSERPASSETGGGQGSGGGDAS
jgi:regulator of protease activity HflC (stomatin/prohibitin superfamily)